MSKVTLLFCTFLSAFLLISWFDFSLTASESTLEGFDFINIREVFVQNFYAREYAFIPASHPSIEYHGRWMPSPNLTRYETSFAGSSIAFAVQNTTSIYLALANSAIKSLHHEVCMKGQLILLPGQTPLKRAGPIDIIVSNTAWGMIKLQQNAHGVTMLEQGLQMNETYTFKVSLPYNKRPNTLQVEGVWVSQGGLVTTPLEKANAKKRTKSNTPDIPSTTSSDQYCSRKHQRLIEVVATASIVLNGLQENPYNSFAASWPSTWPELLEQHFLNFTTSLVPLDESQCLTQRCQRSQRKDQDIQAIPLTSEIFFRSGRPGTDLYRRPWPFSASLQGKMTPTAIILVVGLADIIEFLRSSSGRKHEVDGFLDEFARAYSAFIQTIRRTAYSASSIASYQTFDDDGDDDYDDTTIRPSFDESYLYNSAPSTLPIFLVLQPLPSSLVLPLAEQIATLLHHGTSAVIDDLKWHVGDKRTFLVDTAGWLVDEDFQQKVYGEGEDGGASGPGQVRLTQAGHVKFAHHMSLHLCHYVVDRGAGETRCPFDRHDVYVGNLYLPDAENIRKILEEKKIAAVKEIFGV